jgi:hypothetical protein
MATTACCGWRCGGGSYTDRRVCPVADPSQRCRVHRLNLFSTRRSCSPNACPQEGTAPRSPPASAQREHPGLHVVRACRPLLLGVLRHEPAVAEHEKLIRRYGDRGALRRPSCGSTGRYGSSSTAPLHPTRFRNAPVDSSASVSRQSSADRGPGRWRRPCLRFRFTVRHQSDDFLAVGRRGKAHTLVVSVDLVHVEAVSS